MGREVRRVPLMFDWPLGKVWEGFINPYYKPCPEAEKNLCVDGWTPAGKWLDAVCRLLALLGEQAVEEPHAEEFRKRGQIFPHPYLEQFALAPRTQIPYAVEQRMREIEDGTKRRQAFYEYREEHPSELLSFGEDLIEFVSGLAKMRPDPPFSSCIYQYNIQKALMAAAGIDSSSGWGQCKVCNGHGIDPSVFELYNDWQREDPPAGDGYQLWETVSEGAPISPVFATQAELVDWMSQPDEKNGYPRFPWAQGYKREYAESFVKGAGSAPSLVVADGRVMGGVEAMAELIQV